MKSLKQMSLLGRIALFLVAFVAVLLLQGSISYYQERFVLGPQQERSQRIHAISQFLSDAEDCIRTLENYRWDYGDAQTLIASVRSYQVSSAGHVESMGAQLGVDSEEQYLLANAAATTYATYRETVYQILAYLEEGQTDQASALYYTTARPCGSYMRSYTQQLLECAIMDSQSAYAAFTQRNNQLNALRNVLMAVCFFFGGAVLTALYSLLRRVGEMVRASREISRGNLDAPDVDESIADEIGNMARAFNEMKRSMKRQVQTLEERNRMELELYQKQNEALELQNLMEREKLQQLRSQINPHFLLNTMNVILYTARQEKAERTQSLIQSLARLLRYALGSNDTQVALSTEVNIVDQLYALYRARFGQRVNLCWEPDPEIDLTETIVPSFILQPLVENAFRHGIGPKESGGTVRVRIWPEGEILYIRVEDDGVGMSPAALEELRQNLLNPPTMGEHIGVYNVAARLKLLSPDGCFGLDMESEQGRGTAAVLRLPYQVRKEEEDEDTDC